MANTTAPPQGFTSAADGGDMVEAMRTKGPLAGMRVLTVDNYFAGNYGPLLLAMHGAEVVKIEQPGSGDPLRTDVPYLVPETKGMAHGVVRLMRGKSSVALDIRTPEGKAVLERLVGQADVFWTNLRPGAALRAGINPEVIQALNPRLVYASLSGFGLPSEIPGPFQNEPAFDIIIHALTGIMSRNADPDGMPHYNGVAIADQVTSLYAAFGVVMALLARDRGAPAALVDVAMFDSMIALNEKTFTLFSMDGVVRPPRISATNSPFGAYRGSDGYLVIGVGGTILWQRFCTAIGREDLRERADLDTGVKRVQVESTVIRPLIEDWLRDKTVAQASAILLKHEVPASPILEIDSPVLREQALSRGITSEVTLPGGQTLSLVHSPVRMSTQARPGADTPPELGADSDRILESWIGMGAEEIGALRRKGVIA